MKTGKIILIAAVANNSVIGKTNELPWYLPEDLKRFKQITTGKTVLMGRKTFESILNRIHMPLPNRENFVITTDLSFKAPEGVKVFYSINEAILANTETDMYVIGGASIYAQTIDQADTLLITEIHESYEGDVFFPKIDLSVWKETHREDHDKFSFVQYDRKST